MQNDEEPVTKIFRMKPEVHTIKVKTVFDYYSSNNLGEVEINGATYYIDEETLEALYEEVNV